MVLSSPIHLLPLLIDSSDDIRQCSGYSPSLSSSLGDLSHTWCFSSHMYVQDTIFQSGLLFSSLGSHCLWSSLFNYWQVEGQLGEMNVIESRQQLHVKTSLCSVWASSATWGWLEFLSLAGTAMGTSCDWITTSDTSREKTWCEELWTLLHPVTSDEKKIVVIWSAVGKAGHTLWKCVCAPVDVIQHQNGRENSWCGIQVRAAASLVHNDMLWQFIGDREGAVYGREQYESCCTGMASLLRSKGGADTCPWHICLTGTRAWLTAELTKWR